MRPRSAATGFRVLPKSALRLSRSCADRQQRCAPVLNKDFREFVELLDSIGVEYLVVGGYALAAHGHPRYTGDLDIWVRPTAENIDRVLDALNRFGFASLGLRRSDFQTPGAMVQLGYAPSRIDLLTGLSGVEFDACYPRRVEVALAGLRLPFIGLDDFRANKRAVGRPQDLADLDSLDGPNDVDP